jgi:hypothetical protein
MCHAIVILIQATGLICHNFNIHFKTTIQIRLEAEAMTVCLIGFHISYDKTISAIHDTVYRIYEITFK